MTGRIEGWLFRAGTPERLAALRIGLCAILTWRLTRGIFLDLSGQPAELFRPRSFMHLFASQPGREVVLAAQATGIAAGALATAGLFARVSLPVAWAAGMLLNGMVTSNGKIMHNDVLLLLCLVPLLAAPVSDVWSLGARRRARPAGRSWRYGWPVQTALVVVAGAYFFSGLAKLVHSGPSWVTGGNMRWLLYASSDSQASPNALALFVADRAWLAHAVAGATLAVELSFPLVIWRERLAPLLALAAAGLHIAIWTAMGLDYAAMAATTAIVLVDWPRVLGWRMQEGAGQGPAPSATNRVEGWLGIARWGRTKPSSVRSREAASASPWFQGDPGKAQRLDR